MAGYATIKNDILTLPLTPPENYRQIFKNQKLNATSQTPIKYTTIYQYASFIKYLHLQRHGPISTSIPHMWSDLRTTYLLPVGDSPDQLVKVSVGGGS